MNTSFQSFTPRIKPLNYDALGNRTGTVYPQLPVNTESASFTIGFLGMAFGPLGSAPTQKYPGVYRWGLPTQATPGTSLTFGSNDPVLQIGPFQPSDVGTWVALGQASSVLEFGVAGITGPVSVTVPAFMQIVAYYAPNSVALDTSITDLISAAAGIPITALYVPNFDTGTVAPYAPGIADFYAGGYYPDPRNTYNPDNTGTDYMGRPLSCYFDEEIPLIGFQNAGLDDAQITLAFKGGTYFKSIPQTTTVPSDKAKITLSFAGGVYLKAT